MELKDWKQLFENAVFKMRETNERRREQQQPPNTIVNVFKYVFGGDETLQKAFGDFAKKNKESFERECNISLVLKGKKRELHIDPFGQISFGANVKSSSSRRSSLVNDSVVNSLNTSQADEVDLREVRWQSVCPICIASLTITLPI